MKHFANMIKEVYNLKEGTKNSWVLIETESSQIGELTYKNIVESSSFFRRLGGSEHHQRCYTCRGYLTTKLTSKNPDRNVKIVRKFEFI